MTQEEVARKCASANVTCGFGECPFLDVCLHNKKACVMQQIALMLRSNLVELNKKDKQLTILKDLSKTLCTYIDEIEDLNRRYHEMYSEYQAGYKAKPKRRKSLKRVTRKNATKYDGNPKYADPNLESDYLQEVII